MWWDGVRLTGNIRETQRPVSLSVPGEVDKSENEGSIHTNIHVNGQTHSIALYLPVIPLCSYPTLVPAFQILFLVCVPRVLLFEPLLSSHSLLRCLCVP